jgi:hypothetical protein
MHRFVRKASATLIFAGALHAAGAVNSAAPIVLAGSGGDVLTVVSRRPSYFKPVAAAMRDGLERIVLGFGNAPPVGEGHGQWRVNHGAPLFDESRLGFIPWTEYSDGGGGTRPAAGDLDNDGVAEIVIGLGPTGQGRLYFDNTTTYLQVPWPAYNAVNGETYPAIGNVDQDPAAEIVVGLGVGGMGFYYVFDDALTGYQPFGEQRGWYRVPWPTYNAGADGSVRPAIGDTDGDGIGEILLGLGPGSNGYIAVVEGDGDTLSLRTWIRQTWPVYNAANGETFPAAGDFDGDGLAEIAIGMGLGAQGYIELRGNALEGLGNIGWLNAGWPGYNAAIGEVHPAIGNIDGDAAGEVVVGLNGYVDPTDYTHVWMHVLDDANAGFAHLAWVNETSGHLASMARAADRFQMFVAIGELE